MAYTKRIDGRKLDQTREIEAKVGVIPKAKGSAFFRFGKTHAYAAVYGPRELHPKHLQNPKTGILRCTYNMLPFSGTGNRVRPGPNRRAKEISMVSEHALMPVMDLSEFPNTVVDVFMEIPQADAGTRCAGICAASMALADAGFRMTDLPVAFAIGAADGTVFADPNYDEEVLAETGTTKTMADIALTVLPRKKEITLLQMDGEIKKEQLKEIFDLSIKTAEKIKVVMQGAIKAKYKGAS
ncbi:exosome complex exonuclease Rrp41, partial [Candidatus Woesearchaeota archaeon]|nr:exosome complex exonuclease Rrp41 [Candidatus Woesearchaeota archaeon]